MRNCVMCACSSSAGMVAAESIFEALQGDGAAEGAYPHLYAVCVRARVCEWLCACVRVAVRVCACGCVRVMKEIVRVGEKLNRL